MYNLFVVGALSWTRAELRPSIKASYGVSLRLWTTSGWRTSNWCRYNAHRLHNGSLGYLLLYYSTERRHWAGSGLLVWSGRRLGDPRVGIGCGRYFG
jgi:hypothetical protein